MEKDSIVPSPCKQAILLLISIRRLKKLVKQEDLIAATKEMKFHPIILDHYQARLKFL